MRFFWLPLLVALLSARGARADDGAAAGSSPGAGGELGARLDWRVPAESGCPDHAWAEGRIRTALASGPRALQISELSARVVIERDERGYQVDIETASSDGRGRRHVAGSTCIEVAEAATVIVALAIDARALAEESRPSPGSAEPPLPEDPPEASNEDASRRASRYFVRALGTFDLGTLPRASAGIEAQLGARFGRFVLAARAGYLPPVSGGADEASGLDAGGRFSALEVTAVGCWNEAWSASIWTDLCGGAGMNVLFAEGFGAESLTASVDPALALPFDASLGVKIHGTMSLWVGGGGRVLTPRRAYAIENLGAIYTPTLLAVHAVLGIEIGW